MILVNGAVTESVAATDRGLAYGDGAFRTLLARQGRALHWGWHHRKLEQDCRALAIACPAAAVLEMEIGQAAGGSEAAVVKIIVTRGVGARGYAPPASPSPTRIVIASGPPRHPPAFAREGVAVRVCETRYGWQPRLAGVKHLNRLENVLARSEWEDAGVAEGIMLDPDGNVVGGTMTNLLIVEGEVLVTPSLARCGVAGVARARALHAAARAGIACREEVIPLSRFYGAREAMLVNSVIGAWQVRQCGSSSWAAGTWTRRVREWLDDESD